jgi:hypothetical protein
VNLSPTVSTSIVLGVVLVGQHAVDEPGTRLDAFAGVEVDLAADAEVAAARPVAARLAEQRRAVCDLAEHLEHTPLRGPRQLAKRSAKCGSRYSTRYFGASSSG